ncbi:NACHT domain-containing protein [Shinella sp. S4-D37]|uniref:NACHT domain-containing protein n=1 Tax=Shinella sp. S4-D37 TaxID=3161999 RepID=UPI0034670882
MIDIWTTRHTVFQSEADVETRFVMPLLQALGHDIANIVPKKPVLFREGRNSRPGRKPEADFVVYADKPHCRATALLVVETKHPKEPLDQGREQAESYAQNLRTPLYILTNGHDLEVWQLQIVGESELVHSGLVEKIASSQGLLEGLASRDALISLCSGLRFKNMDVIRRDLSEYEINETARCQRELRNTVPRFLSRSAQGDMAAEAVLDGDDKGAIVLGSSGYGKTTLGKAFLLEVLEKRLEGSAAQLPFEVFLPDVPAGEGAFEAYLVNRVAPHVPGYTLASLRDEAKTNGVLIIADAFDRVSNSARQSIASELRNLVRDFPKSRLLVLSRPNCVPDIELPTYRLSGFDEKDLLALLTARQARSDRSIARVKIPDHLRQLCQVPLLANLVANHSRSFQRFPTNVNTLYEEWLGEILRPFPALEKGRLRAFLEELAAETSAQPVQITRCWELAKGMDISAGLEQLADADAITIRGTSVELVHEGLADFFRVQRLLRLPLNELELALDAIDNSDSSQLPGLLLSGATTPEASRVIWHSLAERNIQVALSSLKFTIGDGERRPVSSSPGVVEGLLSDVLSGIDALLEPHFSAQLTDDVRMCLVGKPVSILGIEGNVRTGWLDFSFFDAGETGSRVRLGEAESPFREWGVSLEGQGYDADAGRILGAQQVSSAIKELIDYRRLRGGPIWREETVFGRLRHLGRRHGLKFETPYDLEACKEGLRSFAHRRFGPRLRTRGQFVDVDALIEDINQLLSDGVTVLHPWWVEPYDVDFTDPSERASLAATFDAFFRRRQQAYVEIVEQEMPGLAGCLPEYASIPVRYNLKGSLSDVQGTTNLHLYFERWPVAELEDAGADLSFPERPQTDFSSNAMDAYVSKTELMLARTGRIGTNFHIVRGGMPVPQFNGRSYRANDREDETAVVSSVMKMLGDDCQKVFGVIPEFRWR